MLSIFHIKKGSSSIHSISPLNSFPLPRKGEMAARKHPKKLVAAGTVSKGGLVEPMVADGGSHGQAWILAA
jgi:hypothetical protein